MANKVSSAKVRQAEDMAITVMERFWIQTDNKKNIARIITFIVLAVAVFQELYFESHLTDNWYEITVYLLMGYFGIGTYRSIFKLQ